MSIAHDWKEIAEGKTLEAEMLRAELAKRTRVCNRLSQDVKDRDHEIARLRENGKALRDVLDERRDEQVAELARMGREINALGDEIKEKDHEISELQWALDFVNEHKMPILTQEIIVLQGVIDRKNDEIEKFENALDDLKASRDRIGDAGFAAQQEAWALSAEVKSRDLVILELKAMISCNPEIDA